VLTTLTGSEFTCSLRGWDADEHVRSESCFILAVVDRQADGIWPIQGPQELWRRAAKTTLETWLTDKTRLWSR
jgi:hypothetical protein